MQYRPLGVLTFLIDNTLLEKKTQKKLFSQKRFSFPIHNGQQQNYLFLFG